MSQPAPLPSIGLVLGSPYTLTAEQGSYSVTGQDAALAGGAPLSPAPLPHLSLLGGFGGNVQASESGSYSLSGQAATLLRGLRLVADAGFYTQSGQPAIFNISVNQGGDPAPLPHLGLLLRTNATGYTLVADAGIYTVSGSEGLADFEMSAAQGSYGITGQDADLRKTSILVAEAGSYSITGQDATFEIGSPARTLTAEQSTYTVTGYDAGLYVGRYVAAEQGFYALLGQAAGLVYGVANNYSMLAETGTYQVLGQDAGFVLGDPVLAAETGVYSIDGQSVRTPNTDPVYSSGGWEHVIRRSRKEKRREEEKRQEPIKAPPQPAPEPAMAVALKRAVTKPDLDPKLVEVIADQIRRAQEPPKTDKPRKPSEEEIALLLILAETKKQPA